MRIPKRYWFGILALALVGGIVVLLLPASEPIVKERPLGYWLDEIHANNVEDSSVEFQKALPAIGDRCIPWLIDELNWKPSPTLRKTEQLSRKWFHWRLDIEPRDRREEAAIVLGWFGSRASNAIPALENMSRFHKGDQEEIFASRGIAIAALILIRGDSIEACAKNSLDLSNRLRRDYHYAIVSLGTNAVSCIPVYIDAIRTTTNLEVRFLAAHALGGIRSRPELSLPVLVSMLNETNRISRYAAAFALEVYGSGAKSVWNDLVPRLNDSDESVRRVATNALATIDPVAAQQLGINGPPMP